MNLALLPAINNLFSRLNELPAVPHFPDESLYSPAETTLAIPEFLSYLQEAGKKQKLFYLLAEPTITGLEKMLARSKSPVMVCQLIDDNVVPVVVQRRGKVYEIYRFTSRIPEKLVLKSVEDIINNICLIPDRAENQTYLLTCLVHQPAAPALTREGKETTHLGRLFQLLAVEKKEVGYIYIYAAIAGIISLSLPLGIQSIIGFVSGGQMSTSIVVLIAVIVLGMLAVGGLQLMQV